MGSFFFSSTAAVGQELHLYSVTALRQLSGDWGYTLDGPLMDPHARSKLVHWANFSPNGTYKKTVVIHDEFATSGSLAGISGAGREDLFFFGTFDKNNGTTVPFTDAELDSVYSWSMRGGKVIIAHGVSVLTYDTRLMNSRYGFEISAASSEQLIPVESKKNVSPFEGPFGPVSEVMQAGAAQGYFSKLPENSSILATDGLGRPTLVMDCQSLDLLVADVDVFTIVNRELTVDYRIKSAYDRFWVNCIAFMDQVPSPPVLSIDGNNLSVNNDYASYQWFRNNEPIEGATGSSWSAGESGMYHVEVPTAGGCLTKSKQYFTEDVDPALNCEPFVPAAFSPDGNGLNEQACVYAYCLREQDFRIFDRWGEQVFSSTENNGCWDGTFRGRMLDSGVFAWTLKATTLSGKKISDKGHITLIR